VHNLCSEMLKLCQQMHYFQLLNALISAEGKESRLCGSKNVF